MCVFRDIKLNLSLIQIDIDAVYAVALVKYFFQRASTEIANEAIDLDRYFLERRVLFAIMAGESRGG